MATAETVPLNDPHPPQQNAIDAFTAVQPVIKAEIIKWRRHWDQHEPRMWSRAAGISNEALTDFDLQKDLVEVRSGPTSYGTVIFGKLRIPAINDDLGEGYIHVRIHDPPNRGTEDVLFHSLFTDETTWRAIQTKDTPLEFFNE
ncbi:hypothetical protein LshimejAT787_0406750 [Lyophyllum shimeji]|uniref:Uncharacterized protein n=1 Tax=Lyophyllum shimeji TaxID=47721 RepID=A0A9P3PLG3_LYOSH|nr:hypothetical protein LshimejAT787_0406750 [Lyophyllum shimeji]